ncbi:uncharacterized protein KY384_002496 [Bacidia gigantensis]|uniref:uncharacterized protein n=1 Tax=Bacidia gigantensis TaxID=2732470 RepID=UPI001D04426C|nr:uncharacterized protein KY384_002496 [Bacidia gigantensis]KAG8532619.1 hypothetical protein KY384_002496 [Bacidia gigantensis]
MKFFHGLLLALLPHICHCARKSTDVNFDEYQSKFLASPPLKLDDNSYEALTSSPRNYSLVVLLTALEARFGCQLCKEFQPEWEVLGKSWAKVSKNGQSRTLFGTVDFNDGKSTFQKLMLQTAPVLLLFPPTMGPDSKPDDQPIRYDFTAGPQSAEQIQHWIRRHLSSGPHIPIRRPLNYVRVVTMTTIVLGILTFLGVAYPYVGPFLQNRNLWAAISLLIILLFTSGHMFNHIRKVPYVAGDGKGGINYFAGGFSNQFGMETQIIAAIYGTLSFATIALALRVPRMTDPKRQQVAVIVWGSVMFGMYSFLLSVFKVKNGAYPFHLPPF